MSKFVGKFRKNQDYNDDFIYADKNYQSKRIDIKKNSTQYEKEILEEKHLLKTYSNNFTR